MSLAGTVRDRASIFRLRARQERIKTVDRIVEEIVVGIAHPDMELTLELGPKDWPVLLENPAQVVALPVLGDLTIDLSGSRIPEWYWAAIGASRPVGCIPRSPLGAGHRPRVALAEHVLEPALMPHRVANLTRNVTG